MKRLSKTEATLLGALHRVLTALTVGDKLTIPEFVDLIHDIRSSIRLAEEGSPGCPWGKHLFLCSCTEKKIGVAMKETFAGREL